MMLRRYHKEVKPDAQRKTEQRNTEGQTTKKKQNKRKKEKVGD